MSVGRRSGAAGALAAAALAGVAAEAWVRRSRATPAERRGAVAGDELLTAPLRQATRATTIAAPAEAVWPWLVQMGFPTRRAGWYTPYWMDRLLFGIRARSAERIVPELQHLALGDVVSDSDSGASFFTVARLDPGRALVLRSHTHPLPIYLMRVGFGFGDVVQAGAMLGGIRRRAEGRTRYASAPGPLRPG